MLIIIHITELDCVIVLTHVHTKPQIYHRLKMLCSSSKLNYELDHEVFPATTHRKKSNLLTKCKKNKTID